MRQSKEVVIGELLFSTKDGNRATVKVYRGKGTFTLKRMMPNGVMNERSKVDVYSGDLANYISEATLVWNDLKPEGVRLEPKF